MACMVARWRCWCAACVCVAGGMRVGVCGDVAGRCVWPCKHTVCLGLDTMPTMPALRPTCVAPPRPQPRHLRVHSGRPCACIVRCSSGAEGQGCCACMSDWALGSGWRRLTLTSHTSTSPLGKGFQSDSWGACCSIGTSACVWRQPAQSNVMQASHGGAHIACMGLLGPKSYPIHFISQGLQLGKLCTAGTAVSVLGLGPANVNGGRRDRHNFGLLYKNLQNNGLRLLRFLRLLLLLLLFGHISRLG